MSNSKEKKPDRAIGVIRTPAGWSMVEYLIDGSRVVAKKMTEPDLRAFALERLAKELTSFWDDE